MTRHARTTITVPAELKARMEAVEDSVNWSAIACQAFEQKLSEFIKRKGVGSMKDVIDRLRASKRAFENEQYQSGHGSGQTWAKEDADAGELIRLSNWRDDQGRYWSNCHYTYNNHVNGGSERFLFRIWPGHDVNEDRERAALFWEPKSGVEWPSDDFVRGFADGALSVWDEVKQEL